MPDIDLKNLFTMVEYLHNHKIAKHDLSDPDLVTDLYTTLDDLHTVLDRFGPDPTLEDQMSWLLRETARQGRQIDEIFAILKDDEDQYPL